MNQAITLLLEDTDGNTKQTSCDRFAIIIDGKELWVQHLEGQLFIGTDVDENDTEFTNLVLRPLATNLVSLQLEVEPIEDDECCQNNGGCDCNH